MLENSSAIPVEVVVATDDTKDPKSGAANSATVCPKQLACGCMPKTRLRLITPSIVMDTIPLYNLFTKFTPFNSKYGI